VKSDRFKTGCGLLYYCEYEVDEWKVVDDTDDYCLFLYSYDRVIGHGELMLIGSEKFPKGIALVACERLA
jgi:hypothetical protein